MSISQCYILLAKRFICLYTLHREAEFRGSEPCERMMEDLSLERRKFVDDSDASSARYFSTSELLHIAPDLYQSTTHPVFSC
jgi:hypothetical protein